MTNLKAIEENLEKDEQHVINKLKVDTSSFKQLISKFTFLFSTIPPIIILILVHLLQWKLLYAFILIIIYNIVFYWIIETKFAYIVHFAQRTKEIILPYFQKLQA